MNYVKFMPTHSIKNASRNIREITTMLECGFNVTIVSSDHVNYINDVFPMCSFVHDNMRKLNYSMPVLKRYIIIVCDIFRLRKTIRKLNVDIISCHNLFALVIGYISNILKGKSKKAKLVYDSHEFEIGRFGNGSKFATFSIKHLEKFLIKHSAFSIMVNDTIANEVQRIHKLEKRPIVVRSTPFYWRIDKDIIKQKRKELLERLSLSEDTFTIMYHGGIMKDRGIEALIELVSMNKEICGIILGNGDEEYLKSLQELAKNKSVNERILFHPAVPVHELWKYVGASDVGMVILRNTCLNHYYSLPNKLFENIQSLTPIIGSSFPEIEKIINQYQIGLTSDPENIFELNNCIEKLRIDKVFYEECKNNLMLAKSELCWENEKKILIQAYILLEK